MIFPQGRLLHVLMLLLCVVQVSSQRVQWKLSNELKDESCDSVCGSQNLKCIEECWPASVTGLNAMLQAPELAGSCFQVSEGPPALWHPAKAEDNSMCYWNPGRSSHARCPAVPRTSANAAAEGRWTRRLCPCLHFTAQVSDCGLGSEPAAQHISDSLASWSKSVDSKAQAQATTAKPVQMRAPAAKPAAITSFVTVPQTCSLCVKGFGGVDSSLNGRYGKASSASGEEMWQLGSVLLEKGANGHWQFRERQMTGKYIPISQGSASPKNFMMPQRDFFSTSTGGWQVGFSSCCGSGASASAFTAGGGTSNDDTASVSAGVVVLIVIVILVVISVVIACFCREKIKLQVMLRFSRTAKFDPTMETTSHPNFKFPDAELGQAGKLFAVDAQKLRAAAGANTTGPSMPKIPGSLPNSHAHGVYEGPMQQWWREGAGSSTPSAEPVINWRYGDKVRIGGLQDSTWNGAVGVVDGTRMDGLIQVKLPDGRLKAVKPENCESPDSPPRLPEARTTGGRRGGAEMRPDVTTNPYAAGHKSNSNQSTNRTDAGGGVTSWLACASTSKQDLQYADPSGNCAESWAKLPQQVATPTRSSQPARGLQPPIPPRGGRSSSCDSKPIGATQEHPARRSASSGPPSRGHPSGAAGATCSDARDNAAQGFSKQQPARAHPGLTEDLVKAQKRTQAKLAALRMQTGNA